MLDNEEGKVKPGKLFYARISTYDGSISGAWPVEDIAEAEALAKEAHIENEYGTRWIVAFALVRNVSVSYAPYSLPSNGSNESLKESAVDPFGFGALLAHIVNGNGNASNAQ